MLSHAHLLETTSLGECWLQVSKRIMEQGQLSRYDGDTTREIAHLTMVVAAPDPQDPLIGQYGDPAWLAWMHENFFVQIEALSSGPVTVGSRYRSTARVNGILFTAELRVTEYQPPSRFAFVGEDETGKFEHQFTFRSDQGGTRVERKINFALTLSQWLMFQILLYPVRLPAGKKALHLLKDRLERAES